MIAVPAYAGTVFMGTMRSIIADTVGLIARGDTVTLFDESGSAMIADARAQMLAEFMASTADHLIMIDHDVVWEPGTLQKLVDAPVDFRAGLYPLRQDPLSWPVWLPDGKKTLDVDPETGLCEVDAVPAGLMCLTRAAVEKMITAYPETAYIADKYPHRMAYALFESVRDPSAPLRKYGEDYSFCQRWKALGEKIWIIPVLKTGHVGMKLFQGTLGYCNSKEYTNGE